MTNSFVEKVLAVAHPGGIYCRHGRGHNDQTCVGRRARSV